MADLFAPWFKYLRSRNNVYNYVDFHFECFTTYIIIVINPVHQNFFGLVEMTYRLVHASYSLPKWQAVKLPFFAPWFKYLRSRMNVYTKILYFE